MPAVSSFGHNVSGLQVEVHAVWTILPSETLWNIRTGSCWLSVSAAIDAKSSVAPSLTVAVQGLGPELRKLSGVVGVEADCQYRDAHDVVFGPWWC